MSLFYADYPIFGLCCTKDEIVLSGGGGGKDYGIEDQIEFYELENKVDFCSNKQCFRLNNKFSTDNLFTLKYINSTTKQKGVVDSMCYNPKLNILVGGIKNTCLLFYIENSSEGKHLRMYLQFQTVWSCGNKSVIKQNVCRFSKNGNFLLTGGTDNTIRLWELNQESINIVDIVPINMAEFHGHEDEILDLDMTYDNLFIISTSRNGTILIHDCETRQVLKKFSVPTKNGNFIVRQCRFIESGMGNHKTKSDTKNRKYLVALLIHELRGNSHVTLWNMKVSNDSYDKLEDGIVFAQLDSVFACNKPSSILTTSHDCKYIGIGTNTGSVKVFINNINNLKLFKEGNFHDLPVTGLYFYKESDYIISTGADYTISVMNVNPENKISSSVTKRKGHSCVLYICTKLIKFSILAVIILLIVKIIAEHYIIIGDNITYSNDIEKINDL